MDTGDRHNSPVCDATATLRNEVSPDLDNYARQYGVKYHEHNAKTLCVHAFYGGLDRRYMGVHCRNPPRSSPMLVLDELWAAPQFTSACHPLSLASTIGLPLLKKFCGAFCHCQHEDQLQVWKRQEGLNKMQAEIANSVPLLWAAQSIPQNLFCLLNQDEVLALHYEIDQLISY